MVCASVLAAPIHWRGRVVSPAGRYDANLTTSSPPLHKRRGGNPPFPNVLLYVMSKANQHPLDVYPLPEPRQLVKMLRQQRGVCNRTDSCICCEIPAQHQAELSFIAEDNLGEPRNVVLEIKPGVPIVKNAGLPIVIHFGLELEARHKRHYDSPIQFDAFLDAVRGGEFKDVDTAYLRELRRKRCIHVNPWTTLPRSSCRWTGRKVAMDCGQIKLKNVPSLISCQRNAMKNSVLRYVYVRAKCA